MFTCLFRTSIKFGRVPREHRPLQQQQQHRSQAIIPPSSRPGVKKKKRAGSQPLQTAASGHLEVWEMLSSLHCAFFFPRGRHLLLFCSCCRRFVLDDGWIYWLSFDPPRSAIKSFTLCRCGFACLCFSESAW